MEIGDILKIMPHRYPLLLVDRILEMDPGKRIVGLKNVTINEPFFQGHFPQRPVMPAVLLMEVMAQATGLYALRSLDDLPSENSIYYFVGVDKARFRKPVEPGDQLMVEVRPLRRTRGIWKAACTLSVDGKPVADAELMGALREIDP